MVIRDRPFERTVTMQKDSTGHVGFLYKNGKITDLVKDSSAARNGLLTDHQMCEINGQNVVGMKVNRIYSQIRILQQNYREMISEIPSLYQVVCIIDTLSLHDHPCVKLTLCTTLFATCGFTTFKDKHIGEVLKSAGSTLTITVMPEFIYDHIVKKVSKGLFKQMDHSIPDV